MPCFSRSRVLTALTALAAFSFAPRATAYCRSTIQEEQPGYEATIKGCWVGDPSKTDRWPAKWLFWKNACVGFSMQRDASSHASLEVATASMERAFAAWEAVSCGDGHPSIHVIDQGPVACGEVLYNDASSNFANQHVIVFRDTNWPHASGNITLALTTMQFDLNTGEIFDADMEINTKDHAISFGGEPGDFDFETIVTHEAGHFLGLAHSDHLEATMYAHYNGSTPSLTADDAAGICEVYPPNGKRSTSDGTVDKGPCDATPRHGFGSGCRDPATDIDEGKKGCACGTVGAPDARGRSLAGVGLLAGLVAIAFRRRRAGS